MSAAGAGAGASVVNSSSSVASLLRALLAAPQTFEVCGVLTAPDRRAGRGRKLQASAVKQVAMEAGLPLLQPTRICAETVDDAAA